MKNRRDHAERHDYLKEPRRYSVAPPCALVNAAPRGFIPTWLLEPDYQLSHNQIIGRTFRRPTIQAFLRVMEMRENPSTSRLSTSAIVWNELYPLVSLPNYLAFSGKTLQASFSEEGLHTTSAPVESSKSHYRQKPQRCMNLIPDNFSKNIHFVYILCQCRMSSVIDYQMVLCQQFMKLSCLPDTLNPSYMPDVIGKMLYNSGMLKSGGRNRDVTVYMNGWRTCE